jgi:hypothetical protein
MGHRFGLRPSTYSERQLGVTGSQGPVGCKGCTAGWSAVTFMYILMLTTALLYMAVHSGIWYTNAIAGGLTNRGCSGPSSS